MSLGGGGGGDLWESPIRFWMLADYFGFAVLWAGFGRLSKSGPLYGVPRNIKLAWHGRAVYHFEARDLKITNG